MIVFHSILLLFFSLQFISESKLFQVVSLFRHGARYHLHSVYDANSTKPYWGELTPVGMRMHENLGKILRKEYIDKLNFLQDSYQRSQIEIFCTPFNRTMQSAFSHMYGLYPLGTGTKLPETKSNFYVPPYSSNQTDSNERIFSMPFGFGVFPLKFNNSLVLQPCKNVNDLIEKNRLADLPTYNEMNVTYYPFLNKLIKIFNLTNSTVNFDLLTPIYDTLVVDQFLGKPFPDSFSKDDYNNLQHLYEWYQDFRLAKTVAAVFNTGKFKKIISEFDDRIKNLDSKLIKWSFLSGHDTDLIPALMGLNISSAKCIEEVYRRGTTNELNCSPNQGFASTLIVELHSDNLKDFYVKIRHNGKYVFLCQKKDTQCDYTDWRQRIIQKTVDPDLICQNHLIFGDPIYYGYSFS